MTGEGEEGGDLVSVIWACLPGGDTSDFYLHFILLMRQQEGGARNRARRVVCRWRHEGRLRNRARTPEEPRFDTAPRGKRGLVMRLARLRYMTAHLACAKHQQPQADATNIMLTQAV